MGREVLVGRYSGETGTGGEVKRAREVLMGR